VYDDRLTQPVLSDVGHKGREGFVRHAGSWRGDIVRLGTSGGGGFGDPKARDSALIKREIRQGYVSSQAAAALYGHTAKTAI
jgi:N-methylhydantoinase B